MTARARREAAEALSSPEIMAYEVLELEPGLWAVFGRDDVGTEWRGGQVEAETEQEALQKARQATKWS